MDRSRNGGIGAMIGGGLLLFAVLIFFAPVLGALGGAFAGWVVGLFFADTILGIFAQFGLEDVKMWQIGMFLGFVGGFFKTTVSRNKS